MTTMMPQGKTHTGNVRYQMKKEKTLINPLMNLRERPRFTAATTVKILKTSMTMDTRWRPGPKNGFSKLQIAKERKKSALTMDSPSASLFPPLALMYTPCCYSPSSLALSRDLSSSP